MTRRSGVLHSRSKTFALAVVLVVLASVAAVTWLRVGGTDASGSTTSRRPAGPVVVDPRGFPRTFSLGRCGYERQVARYDLVVGYAYCNLEALRRLDPNGIFLLNPGLYPTGYRDSSVDYGGMNVTYGSGLYFWKRTCDDTTTGVNLGCIRAFDPATDYLHNADGSVAGIAGGVSGHQGWNLANASTADLVAKVIAYAAKLDGIYARGGWDGIWSDNWIYGVVGKDFAYGPNLDADGDGKKDDPTALRRAWDDGLNAVGSTLRRVLPGKIVGGNGNWYGAEPGDYYGSDPNGWLKTANLTTVEGIERWSDRPGRLVQIARRWLDFPDPRRMRRYILFIQNVQTRQGSRLTLDAGVDPNDPSLMLAPESLRSMRWGLTMSLMAGAYYRLVVNGDSSTLWWYDEYDGGVGVRQRNYLGQPVSAARQLDAGVWRRDFRNGIALNNSSSAAATIALRGRFRHLRGRQNPRLNDGRVVTRVTVQPHDGVVLLRVGS